MKRGFWQRIFGKQETFIYTFKNSDGDICRVVDPQILRGNVGGDHHVVFEYGSPHAWFKYLCVNLIDTKQGLQVARGEPFPDEWFYEAHRHQGIEAPIKPLLDCIDEMLKKRSRHHE